MQNLKTLYLVSTPIGNFKDITYRAIEVLQTVPAIIVEEYKVGKKILDLLKIDLTDKKIFQLNEHIENSGVLSSFQLLSKQKSFKTVKPTRKKTNKNSTFKALINEVLIYPEIALISDAGTPVLADPGVVFVEQLIKRGISIKHISGATAIISALVVSSYDLRSFYYAGFLPQSEPYRSETIKKLLKIKEVIVIMETPYRLSNILGALKKNAMIYGKENIPLSICFDLSMDSENIYRGTISNAYDKYCKSAKNRSPFVIILNNC